MKLKMAVLNVNFRVNFSEIVVFFKQGNVF